jgi:hypothetical protein
VIGADGDPGGCGLREQLAVSVASAAGPYGYTISLGGSTALASDQLGSPHLTGALLLMTGAVLAFVGLEVAARRTLMPTEAPADTPPTIWGNAHIPSAGTALCGVYGVLQLLHGELVWLVTGFTATTLYFVVSAAQQVAFRETFRRRGRRGR